MSKKEKTYLDEYREQLKEDHYNIIRKHFRDLRDAYQERFSKDDASYAYDVAAKVFIDCAQEIQILTRLEK